jgi:hypothetical protein
MLDFYNKGLSSVSILLMPGLLESGIACGSQYLSTNGVKVTRMPLPYVELARMSLRMF